MLSQFVFFTCLSLFLMFADTRFEIAKTLRSSIATVLAPVNRVLSMPGSFVNNAAIYFESQAALKESEQALKQKLLLQSQRASQVEVLGSENAHLRKLLKLQSNLATPSQAAQVLYAVSDPYARKVVIDKGSNSNIALGSPVMDAEGIIGQVVRVYPLYSEVALLIDNEQATPVLNVRTGIRSVMYGRPGANTDTLELRFVSGTADVQVGDELPPVTWMASTPQGWPLPKLTKWSGAPIRRLQKSPAKPKPIWGMSSMSWCCSPRPVLFPTSCTMQAKVRTVKKGLKNDHATWSRAVAVASQWLVFVG